MTRRTASRAGVFAGIVGAILCAAHGGCGGDPAPAAECVRLARDDAIAAARFPGGVDPALWLAADPFAGDDVAAARSLDGTDAWRYVALDAEFGDAPARDDEVRELQRLQSERGGAALHVPPGYGAALWIDPPLDGPLRVVAHGDFGAGPDAPGDPGAKVQVVWRNGPAPEEVLAGTAPLPAGTVRRDLEERQRGRVQTLAAEAGARRLYLRPMEDADGLLLLVTANAGSIARVDRIDLFPVAPLRALAAEREISAKLVARVEHGAVFRKALVLAPGTTVETAPLALPDEPVLRVSLAALTTPGAAPAGRAVRAEIRSDGRVLANLPLHVPGAAATDWIDVECALPGDLPERVTFAFALDGTGAAAGVAPIANVASAPVVVALGSPRVLSRRGDPEAMRLVLVSLDTLRADRLGCYGNARGLTPHLDALAQEATLFERAYAQAPYTLPSHVSLFSGALAPAHGVETPSDRIPEALPLLADLLAARGFQTASYNTGNFVGHAFGHDRGIDEFCEIDAIGDRYATGGLPLGKRFPDGSTGSLERALAFLAENRDRTAYLFLHTFMVHCYLPPEPLARAFGLLEPGAPPLTFEAARRFEPLRVAKDGLSPADRRLMLDAYDATVQAADAMVGDVVRFLKESGQWDRTILAVTSDHGQELFDHGSTGHGITLYEELIHVPLLVRVPGRGEGARAGATVNLADLAPTLLELLDVEAPAWTRDRSFAQVFDGAPLADHTVIASIALPGTSVRACVIDGGFKFIRSAAAADLPFQPAAPEELYDLAADPAEQVNLVRDAPEPAARLRALLDRALEASRLLRERLGSGAEENGELPPELEESLREMGYLGGK